MLQTCRRICLLALPLSFLALPAAATAQECLPGGGGMLKTTVAGAIDAEIDWANDGTICTGNGTPYFVPVELSHRVEGGGTLVVTFQIKGIGEGETGQGLAAQVSISGDAVEMGMFRTAADACTIDVTEHALVEDGPQKIYRVAGTGSCASAVDSAYDDRSITIGDFEFTGRTTWSQ